MTEGSVRSVTADAVPECYTRTFEPLSWNGRTIVLVHGAMHTGEHYVRTPDGRPGWAYDFVDAGYRVLVPDWPGVGLSPSMDPALLSAAYICRGLAGVIEAVDGPVDLLVHSMSGPYGFALLESHAAQIDNLIAIAPGQPAELAAPPDIIDDLGDEIRQVYGSIEFRVPKQACWMPPTRDFVTDKLIGASRLFPAVDPDAYLRTLVPMWSGLAHERLATVCAPRDTRHAPLPLPNSRVLVMTGTDDRDHSRETDGVIVDWLRTRGAAVTFCYLGEVGIDGNSHMLMLDTNSAELAQIILSWLRR